MDFPLTCGCRDGDCSVATLSSLVAVWSCRWTWHHI